MFYLETTDLMKTKKTRKELRDERAEKVCQEVRRQMAKHSGITDNERLYNLLVSWMKVTGKSKYDVPFLKKQ